MVETNHDDMFDRLGSFYGSIINLDEDVSRGNETMATFNETTVLEKQAEDDLIVTVANATVECVEEEETESPVSLEHVLCVRIEMTVSFSDTLEATHSS